MESNYVAPEELEPFFRSKKDLYKLLVCDCKSNEHKAIISTLNPDATKHLVAEARAKRSIQKEQEDSNLVKLTPELKDEIMNSVRF